MQLTKAKCVVPPGSLWVQNSTLATFNANICYKYFQGYYKDSSVYKVHQFSDSQKEVITGKKNN